MGNLTLGLRFDFLSFWTGVLAGIFITLIIRKISTWLRALRDAQQVETPRQEPDPGGPDLVRLKNDTLLFAQGWHIAAGLFPLDEILVEPRLLAPPLAPDALAFEYSEDISDWAIPYMPDWPEVGSRLGSPTLSLAEAMSGGCNLAVAGQAGAGKSVALAYLAIQLIRKSTGIQEFEQCTPLLVRVGDLALPVDGTGNLLTPLQHAVEVYASAGTRKNLERVLVSLFETNHALLIVDGLDVLPPSQAHPIVEYLGALRKEYPGCRLALSVSLDFLDGLFALDVFPFALATWSPVQRLEFTRRWSTAWSKCQVSGKITTQNPIDSWMLHGWLANEIVPHSSLETAMRCWAAFAGDALGAKPHAALEAHIRRLTCHLPARTRPALEHLALQMVRTMQPMVLREDAEAWLSGSQSSPGSWLGGNDRPAGLPAFDSRVVQESAPAPGSLSALIDCGVLVEFGDGRVGMLQPAFLGYLAGEALLRSKDAAQLVLQPEWSGKFQTLRRFCSQNEDSGIVDRYLKTESADLLLQNLLNIARWLRDSPENSAWARKVMSRLAACVQQGKVPFSLKVRSVSALVLSGYASVRIFIQQLLESNQDELRQLGILGCGLLGDAQSVQKIQEYLTSRSTRLRSAAALSLVAIRNKPAMEALASALLHGDDVLRKASAEALSRDSEEGYPTLREGSLHPDPLVRRSVVFGLQRIKADWVKRTLVELRDNDAQWIVKDAAAQALEGLQRPDPHIPQPIKAPTQAHWLIGFAAERNMVVPSGKAAVDMIHRCLREGNEEQVLSAVHYIGFRGSEESVAPLYQVFSDSTGERCEVALIALQRLASTGVALPTPAYLGMA